LSHLAVNLPLQLFDLGGNLGWGPGLVGGSLARAGRATDFAFDFAVDLAVISREIRVQPTFLLA